MEQPHDRGQGVGADGCLCGVVEEEDLRLPLQPEAHPAGGLGAGRGGEGDEEESTDQGAELRSWSTHTNLTPG